MYIVTPKSPIVYCFTLGFTLVLYIPWVWTNVYGICSVAQLCSVVTLWTVACQAPLSMGFSRQEYWSMLSFPLQGIFLTQGLNSGLLHCWWILYSLSYEGSPMITYILHCIIQSIFTLLKILCALPVHLPLLTLTITDLCTFSSFAFSRISYNWQHKYVPFLDDLVHLVT